MGEHTSGPWRWDGRWLFNTDNEMLLYYTNDDDGIHLNNESDAKLIAAAPDLLEALQFLMEAQFKSADRDNMEFDARLTCFQLQKARAVIAKATT